MNILMHKFKEVLAAVAPVAIFVVILHFTAAPLPGVALFQFFIGALFIITGLAILLFGVDIGILPLGDNMGLMLVKSNKLWFVLIVGLLVGFFINFAEPDVAVLASEVASVSGNMIPALIIRIVVAMGAGTLLTLGITRIVKNLSYRLVIALSYGAAFFIAIFASADMAAIAFDASGAATGAITVPLVLALSAGLASSKKDSKSAEEDSFGLVGIMASGAVFGVLILNLFLKTDNIDGAKDIHNIVADSLFEPFIAEIPGVAFETLAATLPIFIMLVIFQITKFHLPLKAFRKMFMGLIYVYIGLVLFFIGVYAGFMNVGNMIGYGLALNGDRLLLVGSAFVLGLLIILTEPAVYVLTHQIENITNGYIKRKTVLIFLAAGVSFAVGLSMLRIAVPGVMFWHYLLPGFVIVFILAFFFTPKMFRGIAFDSGAVASGPMTVTFVLAFSQGASEAVEHSNVLTDSFGIIAMVTMMPVIALQLLGIIYNHKLKKGRIVKNDGI